MKNFNRILIYILAALLSLLIILFNISKINEKEVFSTFLGTLLGIISFEATYHFVLSIEQDKKKTKKRAILFFLIFFILILILLIFSKSIFFTILGYTAFVLSLLITVFFGGIKCMNIQ